MNNKMSELHTNNIRFKSDLGSRTLDSRQKRMFPLLRSVKVGAAAHPASDKMGTENYLTRSYSLVA